MTPLDVSALLDAGPDLDEVVASFVTTEYSSLTRAGAPVTFPVTPYLGASRDDGTHSLDVSTGLTYPLKAERARRDPRVTLSFSDPCGSGIDDPPIVIVKGLATVRDRDLVANSARYLRESFEKFPEAPRPPVFVQRRMDWYWARIWIEVTPVEVIWWPHGDLTHPPQCRRAPEPVLAPPSDPAPGGRSSGSWNDTPVDWRKRVRGAVDRFGPPVVTTVDPDGWPIPWRARAASSSPAGFVVTPPAGIDVGAGPASVTFHHHGAGMAFQENVGLVATASPTGGGEVELHVHRALTDCSIPHGLRSQIGLMRRSRPLRARLAREATRRGQTVPTYDDVAALI